MVVIDQFISLNVKPRLELLLLLALSHPERVIGATLSRSSQLFVHGVCHETKVLPSLYIVDTTKYDANGHVRRSRNFETKEHVVDCPSLRFGEQ